MRTKKCVCGEQVCLGGAEVEIGGICHRPNNPCYVELPRTMKSSSKAGKKEKKCWWIFNHEYVYQDTNSIFFQKKKCRKCGKIKLRTL